MPGANLNLRNTPQPTLDRTPAFSGLNKANADSGVKADSGRHRTGSTQTPGKPILQRMADAGQSFQAGAKSVANRIGAWGESAMARMKGVTVDEYRAANRSALLDKQLLAHKQAGVSGDGKPLASSPGVDLAAHAKSLSQIDRRFGAGSGIAAMAGYQETIESERGKGNSVELHDKALEVDVDHSQGWKLTKKERETSKYGKDVIDRNLSRVANTQSKAADTKRNIHEAAVAKADAHARLHAPAQAVLSQVAAARNNNTELYQAVNSAFSFVDNNISPGKASVNNVLAFVESNIDICTNPAFYSYGANAMRGNFPIIGLAAGLAIVEGIRTRGEATAKDLNDLRGAINPFERPKELDASERRGGDFLPIPVIADNLLGPVTEQNMMALTEVLMGRFAGISFNTDATTEATLLQNINTSANAADKLTQIRTALIQANQGNGMGPNTFEQGLQAIEAFAKDPA